MNLRARAELGLGLLLGCSLLAWPGQAAAEDGDGSARAFLITGVAMTATGITAAGIGAALWASGEDRTVMSASANDPPSFREIRGGDGPRDAGIVLVVTGSLLACAGVPVLLYGTLRAGGDAPVTGRLVIGPASASLRGSF